MAVAGTPYVQEREGALFVGDTRVSLASLVAARRNEGYTAEELQIAFPSLSLAQVYGSIAYFLDHRDELEQTFAEETQQYWAQRAQDRSAEPDFYRGLDERRDELAPC